MTRSIVLLALVLAGCLPAKPTVVIPPTPATMGVHVQVNGASPIAGALVRLKIANPDVWLEAVTPESGHVLLTVPASLTDSQLQISAPGWVSVDQHVVVSQDCTLTVTLTAAKPPPPPRLHTDGILFATEAGPWRWKGITAFPLYKLWLEGQDITPFLKLSKSMGANLVRVLGAYTMLTADPFGWLDPRVVGERYWTNIPAFIDLVASKGLRTEWVALADQECDEWSLCVSVDEARGWLSRLSGIFAGRTDVTLEVANEPQFNGVDPADFMATSTAGVLTASGNYDVAYDGSMTTLPNVRDYVTVHSERGDEWPRKFKDPAREFGVTGFDAANGVHFNALHKPIVGDEPIGAGEGDQYGRRSTVARDFRDYGAVCGLFASGCTFHFENGLTGTLPGPLQEAAGRAFFAGMDAIPLDAPTWTYTAGHLSDCPLEFDTTKALRTFCMMTSAQATCVIVRKNYDQPIAKNGWTISGYGSDDKAIVYLTR